MAWLKLRDRDVKEANLEVELDRFRLEKRLSMTRLLSEAAASGTTTAAAAAGELGPLSLPPPTPSPFFGPGGSGGPGSAPAATGLGGESPADWR